MWQVVCWNVRGINDPAKCPAIRFKIEESNASNICLQETKKSSFASGFTKCIWRSAVYSFIPFDGASGGLLFLWVSSMFTGPVLLE
jgi:exonuclease III